METLSSTKIHPASQGTVNEIIEVYDLINKHAVDNNKLLHEMMQKEWMLELIRLNQKKTLSDALIIVYKHKVETSKCIFYQIKWRKRLFNEIKNWRSLNAAILYINAMIDE